MFERQLMPDDVRNALESGEPIEDYPDDQPYPSRLVLGWTGETPLHVVVATNVLERKLIIVTVYVPDPERWSADLRTRRPQ